ncbi:DUF2306 domain-containing protein [Roseobacter sp. YSTF-M11]|uniref:DUF2306 domain-containing protein n=1 Tax=Roseobacter insulae TaxID=2859783 RepID=A0A9X1FYQ9_9RHOB|nr:DUF2306 domain-containing protein [Roseobacter insulae]MBW4709495.1 DUF2306 domain-containing protein [Roseobacter insulae]
MPKSRTRHYLVSVGMCGLVLLMLPFVLHALRAGVEGLSASPDIDSRFYEAGRGFSNAAIFGHMVLGGVLTACAPLQLLTGMRQKWPVLHRWSGRVLVGAACLTGLGGLVFIVLRGTIGGLWMDAGFGVYGALLTLCAIQAVRHARAGRFATHRQWALRLFVLSLGSWLYRVHYGLWYAVTGGVASTATFDGAFDIVQNVAFYLPYLIVLEVWMARSRVQTYRARSTQTSR